MQEEPELIYSQLQQTYTVGDKSIDIQIYRLPQTGWTIEVVDEHGNSTVWNDEFATNTAIAIGPRIVRPSDWLSWVWDMQDGEVKVV